MEEQPQLPQLPQEPQIQIISIEGNIGAGKSTILEHLKETYEKNSLVAFVDEPVEIWGTIRDNTGEDILTKFYKNPTQYAFSFQVMAFATRVHKLREALTEKPNAKILICERSLEADSNIFAQMLYDDGHMESIEHTIYKRYYDIYKNDFKHSGIVFVNATPEKCFERIQKRNRNGENNIAFDYIQKCNKYHVKWLGGNIDQKLLTIDSNIEKTETILNEWKDNIKGFMTEFV